jgi:hypothetical protein
VRPTPSLACPGGPTPWPISGASPRSMALAPSRPPPPTRRSTRGVGPRLVFDVVASRQRQYVPRVVPMVERFSATPAAASLGDLARLGVPDGFGLRAGEAVTMQNAARGLLAFCDRHGHDEESGVRRWATHVAPFEHAHDLDPSVGSVDGIGPALFAYMRMRWERTPSSPMSASAGR